MRICNLPHRIPSNKTTPNHPPLNRTPTDTTSQTKTIHQNPCKLLEDEKTLCESLGIQMRKLLKEIVLYETGRVSVIWEAYTKSEKDTHKWATIAPPSSGPKRKAVEQWLTQPKEKERQPPFPKSTA